VVVMKTRMKIMIMVMVRLRPYQENCGNKINHYWIDVDLLCQISSYQLGINCQSVAAHSTLIPCESV